MNHYYMRIISFITLLEMMSLSKECSAYITFSFINIFSSNSGCYVHKIRYDKSYTLYFHYKNYGYWQVARLVPNAFISGMRFKPDKEFLTQVYIAYAINHITWKTVSGIIKISHLVCCQKVSMKFFYAECNLLHYGRWNAVCIMT